MARPENNTVNYFPWYVDVGKKNRRIVDQKFGNNGIAFWVRTLENLAKTNYHFIDLKEEGDLMDFAAINMVDEEVILGFILLMVKLGEFDKFLWENYKIIWCQKFIDSINSAYAKRKNSCISYNILLQNLSEKNKLPEKEKVVSSDLNPLSGDANPLLRAENYAKQDINPQTIVKYTKLKESILNKGEKVDFFKMENLEQNCRNILKKFQELTGQKFSLTRGIRDSMGEVFEMGHTEEEFIKVICVKGAHCTEKVPGQSQYRFRRDHLTPQTLFNPEKFEKYLNQFESDASGNAQKHFDKYNPGHTRAKIDDEETVDYIKNRIGTQ